MPCKHEGGTDPCDRLADRHCRVLKRQKRAEWLVKNEGYHGGYSNRYRKKFIETTKRVSPGNIGAAGEFLVKADLMLRGFEVTAPCSPTAVHDLHVEFPSVGWTGVQVKVVNVNTKTGTWMWKKRHCTASSPLYALVRTSTKEIRYEAGSEPLPVELL